MSSEPEPAPQPNEPVETRRGVDPYSVQPPGVHVAQEVTVRPTGLTVIAVICLLAGIVGVLSGVFGLVGMLLGDTFANAFQTAGPAQELQQKMNADIQAITRKYYWLSLPLTLAGIVIGGCMTLGGIGVLARKSWSRVFLSRVFLAGVVMELISAVYYAVSQWEMGPVMREHMSKIAESNGSPGGETMGQLMQFFSILGIIFLGVWTVVKVVLMLWGRAYLHRPETKAYLGNATSPGVQQH